MRAELERAVPGVEVLDGTAEAVPLADASVDAVTVAQAFHWFRIEPAAVELHRILRAGGGLGIMWNTRDPEFPLHDAIERVIEPLREDVPAHRDQRWQAELARTGLFAGPDERVFHHVHVVDVDTLVDRWASVSFVAALPADRRRAVLDEIRAFAAEYPEPIDFPYLTRVYVYDRIEVTRTRDHPPNGRGSSVEG
jgi:SAM-dependent methyltransferase